MTKTIYGQYSLFLVMPETSRSFFFTLDLGRQKTILTEAAQAMYDTVDLDKVGPWKNVPIVVNADGFKEESEVRALIASEVSHIGKGSNLIEVAAAPVDYEIDKNFDCSISHHFSYALFIAKNGVLPYQPWVIAPSTTYPQVIFETRVEVTWVGNKIINYEDEEATGKGKGKGKGKKAAKAAAKGTLHPVKRKVVGKPSKTAQPKIAQPRKTAKR